MVKMDFTAGSVVAVASIAVSAATSSSKVSTLLRSSRTLGPSLVALLRSLQGISAIKTGELAVRLISTETRYDGQSAKNAPTVPVSKAWKRWRTGSPFVLLHLLVQLVCLSLRT